MTMKKTKKLEWGEAPATARHSEGHGCENSDCTLYNKVARNFFDIVIGVRKTSESIYNSKSKEYQAYCRCPGCNHYFWNHVYKEIAIDLETRHEERRASR